MAELKISVEDADYRQILVRAGLFEEDPASIEGLSDRMDVKVGIDPDFQPIPYNTTLTTMVKVRCSVCPPRVWHNSGFIIKNGSGQIGLVGKECGESQIFGEGGWQELVNRTERAQKAALFQVRWEPASKAATAISEQMTDWSRLAEQVDEAQLRLSIALPDLLDRLRHELGDGTLSITTPVSRPYIASDGTQRTRKELTRQVILQTRTGWFFRGRTLSKRILAAQRKLLEHSVKLGPDCTYDEIASIRLGLRATREIVDECVELQESLVELQTTNLWQQVAKWADHEDVSPGYFEVTGSQLRAGYRDEFAYDLPRFPIGELQDAARSVSENWPTI